MVHFFECFAQAAFEHAVVGPAAGLAGAGAIGQQAQALGRVATAAQADQRRHARVVPAADLVVVDQRGQLALAGDHVGQVQPRELVLPRRWRRQQAALDQSRQHPVVPGPLVFELERADAVRDLFERILDRMGVGVHRIDAPFVAGVVVRGTPDPVDRRVAHVDVGAGHVDLGTQHHRAVQVLGVPHFPERVEVFCGGAIAKRAVDAGPGEIAPVDAHVFGALFVHIGVAGADQVFGGPVHEVEVVAGVVQVVAAVGLPVEAEPVHGVGDRVDEFLVFLFGVGVVETQMADTAIFVRQPEVHADALGVADMQVAIGFGRKAGADRRRVGLSGRHGAAPSPGLPPHLRLALTPLARSDSMIWRRKLLVRAVSASWLAVRASWNCGGRACSWAEF